MLALGCGLVASIGITQVMARRDKEPAGPSDQTQPVFVAMTDVGMGDMLTSQDLTLEQWPKGKAPSGTISRLEDIEGRRARTKLYAGEPILDKKLLGKGASEQGATALIPKGYRVVPVKVDLVSGGSSLILPGDRVDVMVHFLKDRRRDIQETVTKTILQDIKVFAVNDVLGLDGDTETGKSIVAKTISLLVTPKQAAKVTLACQLGKIQLVMRSPEDDEQVPDVQATPSELFGKAEKSQRDKESLMEDPETDKPKKSFLDFLDSMKNKLAAGAEQPKPRETWTMQMLRPGRGVHVMFEREEGTATDSALPFGLWKVIAMYVSPLSFANEKVGEEHVYNKPKTEGWEEVHVYKKAVEQPSAAQLPWAVKKPAHQPPDTGKMPVPPSKPQGPKL